MINVLVSSLLIICASMFFVIHDGIINYLSPRNIQFYHFIFYGAPPYILFILYLFFKGQIREKLTATNYFIPLIRGLILVLIPIIAFVSLKYISLPEYTTLNMSAPFFGTILSLFFLKERLNLYLIISLVSGFFGVIFVVQPGFDNFNILFLLVLIGSFFITLSSIMVNKYNTITSPEGYFIYGGIFVHLFSFILFVLDPIFVSFYDLFLILVASIFINIAIFFMIYALQFAQKHYASIFCLVYLQILWSVLVGIFIFDEYLNNYALIGAFLIVLSGLLSLPAQYKQLKN